VFSAKDGKVMPLGVRSISIDEEMCKQCGICVDLCPYDVLASDDKGQAYVAKLEACTGCLLCELLCPDLAINVDMV
jgi:2-oxoglutarate ferredoxin oxidoreductase subunit delta